MVERLPHVPPLPLRLRINLCKLMFLNMLMQRDNGLALFDETLPLPILVDDTLEQMTAALTAPYHHAGSRLFDRLA
jgi:hypothetical protein